MYIVKNDETGKMMGVRLSEDDAFELRDTFENWEDMVIEWMDTEADALLERIRARHDTVTYLAIDDKLNIKYAFRKNIQGEISEFDLIGRFGETLITTNIDTITASRWNDEIVINEDTFINIKDAKVVECNPCWFRSWRTA